MTLSLNESAAACIAALATLCLAAACTLPGDADDARSETRERTRPPGYVVDSVFPMEEELRRFRANIPDTATQLASDFTSRDDLVRRFIAAAASADSGTLRALHISLAEFAWLYFPASEFSRPPYEMKPGLMWSRSSASSNRGLTKAMQLLGGTAPRMERLHCADEPRRQDDNIVWEGCVVHWRSADGEPREARLFGGIIERDGRVKFLSYINNL